MKQHGFTVIELVVVIALFSSATAIGFIQFSNLQSVYRDDQRRTSINAMYYNLEDIFYAKNSFYPNVIDETNLKGVDKDLFTDPNGVKIGNGASDYRYEPTDCVDEKCKSYELRALMEKEDDFIKKSKN
jgi:prepilin-type N-terminal cleavage/methylation domain-containing protein